VPIVVSGGVPIIEKMSVVRSRSGLPRQRRNPEVHRIRRIASGDDADRGGRLLR